MPKYATMKQIAYFFCTNNHSHILTDDYYIVLGCKMQVIAIQKQLKTEEDCFVFSVNLVGVRTRMRKNKAYYTNEK